MGINGHFEGKIAPFGPKYASFVHKYPPRRSIALRVVYIAVNGTTTPMKTVRGGIGDKCLRLFVLNFTFANT